MVVPCEFQNVDYNYDSWYAGHEDCKVFKEIVPFTVEEARRILDAAANVRNGARFVVALTLGLRRGEALGLKWSDLDINWQHGCEKDSECRGTSAQHCPDRQLKSATMTIDARYSSSCGSTAARTPNRAAGSTARIARNGTVEE